jgi:hypothetical protein
VPGALATRVAGVGAATSIVGTYRMLNDLGEDERHGFIYLHNAGQVVITIAMPGAWETEPTAVNNTRQVALSYLEPAPRSGNWRAAVHDVATGAFTPVTVFGHPEVYIAAINDHGDMVGQVIVPAEAPQACACEYHRVPFARVGGHDRVLVPPEWLAWFVPRGLNDHGVVVGFGVEKGTSTSAGSVGFKLDLGTGRWERIVHPTQQAGYALDVRGIDNQGRMVPPQEHRARLGRQGQRRAHGE